MMEYEVAAFPLILALDIGTSSIRALQFDARANPVHGNEARREHSFKTQQDGAVEADADEILRLVGECLDEVLARAGYLASHIAGVSACTFVSNVLGVDAHGQAITPVITYADTRAASDASALRARFDESVVHNRVGAHFHPSYLPARFSWIARTHPGWLDRAARWVSIGEYLVLKLFGEAAVSYSVASWTGLLNRAKLDWDEELLTALPISREQLSRLVDVDCPWRGLRPEFAQRWPTLADIPWFPAIGDGAAANIGSGCVSSQRVAVTVGTTSAVRVVLTEVVERVPEGLWCYRVDRERSLLGGALSEGGSVFAWLKQTIRLDGIENLEEALASIPPDSHGLTFLPLLAGERSPGWRGDLRGAIHGLSMATTPVELVRAALEGIAYRIGLIYQLLRPALSQAPEVIVSGGALRQSPTWTQIIADVLGCPVRVSLIEEASARGTVLLALLSLHLLPNLETAEDYSSNIYKPNWERYQIYQWAMGRQQELYAEISSSRRANAGSG